MKKLFNYTAGKESYIRLISLLIIVLVTVVFSIRKLWMTPGSMYSIFFYAAVMLTVIFIVRGCFIDLLEQRRSADAARNQIARDLHDDLGSTLNSIKLYTALAMQDCDSLYLKKVKETADDAMLLLKDMIWKLDGSTETVGEFAARINCYASSLCKAASIAFHLDIDTAAFQYEISNEEKKNLYLIIKEAINNSIKYAGSKEIKLVIRMQHGKPVIRLADNGCGCKREKMTQGYGMRNMRTRASAIRYKLLIDSTNGTMIQLQKN
jgi:signal transduction histidine kinase